MATGWPMKVTYANGDVYSASDVNDTNGTINLLTSSTLSVAAGKNAIIGGGFDIWQRGTSFAPTGSASYYTADRFIGYRTVAGSTITRQVTNDTTNLPNIQYCMRVSRDNLNASTNLVMAVTPLESVTARPFAGKTVTVSWYARAGANFSAASSNLNYEIVTGTGTDQNPLTGYTGQVAVSGTKTLTTTWQRFSYTQLIPTTATEIAVDWYFTPVGTAGAADYFEITGVQLELGSTATTFSRAGGTIQGELAACQRYYLRATPGSFSTFGSGVNQTTTLSNIVIPFPVTMRTAPTGVEQTGTASDYRMSHTTATTCSAVPVFSSASINQSQISFTVASGLLSGGAALAQSNATTSYLGWSAEL